MRALLLAVLLMAPGFAAAQANPYGDLDNFFGAASFELVHGANGKVHPNNSCGKPADPKVVLTDLDGDGKQNEAVITDTGPCYTTDGKFFIVIARPSANARWQTLYGADGTVHALPSKTGKWFDLEYVTAGKTIDLHHVGDTYVAVKPAAAPRTGAAAPVPAGPATIAGAPLPAKVAQLTAAQRSALFLAGGFKKMGAKWKGCDGSSEARLDDSDSGVTGGAIQDLNGDGRAEVIIIDEGFECYGNTGQGFTIVTEQPDGKWTSLWSDTGIPTFQTSRGKGGWKDVEVGGPGFCFPVSTWVGDHYEIAYYNEYMKGICAANERSPARRKY